MITIYEYVVHASVYCQTSGETHAVSARLSPDDLLAQGATSAIADRLMALGWDGDDEHGWISPRGQLMLVFQRYADAPIVTRKAIKNGLAYFIVNIPEHFKPRRIQQELQGCFEELELLEIREGVQVWGCYNFNYGTWLKLGLDRPA